MNIEIQEVSTNSQLRQFIEFPNHLYKGNRRYIPALTFDEMNTLRKGKNPAFEYCESRYWLAKMDNKIVGRIAAIINHRHNIKTDRKQIRFGWLDFIDNVEVSRLLFEQVEKWAIEKELNFIHGPIGFTDFDKAGLLIEGFDELSCFSTIYNFPYYASHLEQLNFRKDADWIQYEFEVPKEVPEKLQRYAKLLAQKYELKVVNATTPKELLPYSLDMFDAWEEAYAELYGFVPLNKEQIAAYTKQYFGFIRPEYVRFIVNSHNRVVAFAVCIPSLSGAFRKANGKLFPFGWWHIRKALKHNEVIEMYLIGIRHDYQGKGVTAILFNELNQTFIKHGFKKAIALPELEDNKRVKALWKYYEGRQHIRRRCYGKEIGGLLQKY